MAPMLLGVLASVAFTTAAAIEPKADTPRVVSRMGDPGNQGDPTFRAFEPVVAYHPHPDHRSFMIAWSGVHNADGQVAGEREIFVRRYHESQPGHLTNQRRVTAMGGLGDATWGATHPALAAVPEPLSHHFARWVVTFQGSTPTQTTQAIYALGLAADGTPHVNGPLRISTDGGHASQAAIIWNESTDGFFVSWLRACQGICTGSRIEGSLISRQGFPPFPAAPVEIAPLVTGVNRSRPALAYDHVFQRILVTWVEQENVAGQVRVRVRGQFLSALDAAPIGNPLALADYVHEGSQPLQPAAVALNESADDYLVAWNGTPAGGVRGVFAVRVDRAFGQAGPTVRLSDPARAVAAHPASAIAYTPGGVGPHGRGVLASWQYAGAGGQLVISLVPISGTLAAGPEAVVHTPGPGFSLASGGPALAFTPFQFQYAMVTWLMNAVNGTSDFEVFTQYIRQSSVPRVTRIFRGDFERP
ncbi:MAG TPA: hypothetical protein PKZ76_04150 [Xanthomonadaceae bacterium]|nr:hypothetical protein [Xanthomonadaceae bacterium]